MKVLTIISIVFFALSVKAQNLYTKDGVSLGDKDLFIKNCKNSAKLKTLELKGLQINTSSYCSCAANKLIPIIESEDLFKSISENTVKELLLSGSNLDTIMKCLEGNVEVKDNYQYTTDNKMGEASMDIAIKLCTDEIMKDTSDDNVFTEQMAKEYCSCAMIKLYDNGYNYGDLQDLENENSEVFNEIVLPCVSHIMNNNKEIATSNNEYIASDIKGNKASSKIKLVDYLGQGYKVKMTIGGITKYFLFDTGASELIIDKKMRDELIKNKTISNDDFVGTELYEMANGVEESGELYLVNDITFGDYKLKNVTLTVIKNGSLLCGKGFLDKFKKWELIEAKKLLIVYK